MSPEYQQMRALVVDDDVFARQLICKMLHKLGAELENLMEAGDGLEALKILKTNAFDLIISDWHMKPMDGLTLTRKIRDPLASPAPDTPLILCTADPQQDVIERALRIGINQVIVKPINIANFGKRIRATFDAKQPPAPSGIYRGPNRRFDKDRHTSGSRRSNHEAAAADHKNAKAGH